MKKKVILIILDGWGLRKEKNGNAIALAKTPNFDKFWQKYPHAILDASGQAVGLPKDQIGTSEVCHMVIGAGRVVFQDLVKINKAIEDKTFFKNKVFISAFEHVKKNNSVLHIKGLVSPGGVHSHQKHIYALLKMAKQYKVKKVYLHVFTDGRDVLPKSAINYVQELQDFINKLGLSEIASISGRYYSMDRDHNWERTDKAFKMLTKGEGERYKTAKQAIEESYKNKVADEFIKPCLIKLNSGKLGLIKDNDAVIFVNFRSDRPRQLVEKFLKQGPKNLKYVTMCQYNPEYQLETAFPLLELKNTLGEIISKAGLKQLRITETEKFAHLTFFMNSKIEEPFEGEDRIMLNSYSDIATHDKRPEMRTPDIAREVIEDIKSAAHQVIFTNLCNADMVGHTGNIKAAIKGIETVDKAVREIVKTGQKYGFNVIIAADHGNAEEMIDEKTKGMATAHTTNPVPFILISKKYKKLKMDKGSLVNIAPTILKILGLKKPKEITGKSFV